MMKFFLHKLPLILMLSAVTHQLNADSYLVVLDPQHTTELYAEIKTPITLITKKMGDSFRRGELLIQLEDKVLRGNYHKCVAYLNKAETELVATKELYQQSLASLFDLKEAEANLATAQANLIEAEKNLSSCRILAPYSGVVVSIQGEEHEIPQVGKWLIKVIDDKTLIAKMLINSSLLSKIKIGQPVAFDISETGKTIKGVIARIGGMIDPASSTIKIEAEIDNHSGELKAGMTGMASFNLKSSSHD